MLYIGRKVMNTYAAATATTAATAAATTAAATTATAPAAVAACGRFLHQDVVRFLTELLSRTVLYGRSIHVIVYIVRSVFCNLYTHARFFCEFGVKTKAFFTKFAI